MTFDRNPFAQSRNPFARKRNPFARSVSSRDLTAALLVAGASAAIAWLLQSGMSRHRVRKHAQHKAERREAVAQWEGEGGNTAPGHPALTPKEAPARHATH